MPRLLIVLSLLLILAVPAAADAKVRKGPSGSAFYKPPKPLPGGKHGALIWARKQTGAAALKGGAGNRLILYRSTGADGKATAVSGAVAIPKGKAPKGGWPVITWAHGTTGIADQCAPSRDGANQLSSYAYPLLQRWLKAGYAVVRTDYTGLGTPGDHPYLIGRPEGESVLDAVRAARSLDKRLGKRVAIAGHSQGGQAALFAASLAPKYTPDLKIRGTVAFAPVSHLSEQTALLPGLKSPSGLSGLVAMILRGIDIARPSLNVAGMLNDPAAALYPTTLTQCLGKLSSTSSFGVDRPGRPDPAGHRPRSRHHRAVPARRPGGPADPHAAADPAGDRRPDRVPDVHRPDGRRLQAARRQGDLQDLPGRRPRRGGQGRALRGRRDEVHPRPLALMPRQFDEANAWDRFLRRFAATGPGSWLFTRTLDHSTTGRSAPRGASTCSRAC